MKVAILGEGRHGFIKPMALGLKRMLAAISVEADFFADGLAMLDFSRGNSIKVQSKNWLKTAVNQIKPRSFELQHSVTKTQYHGFEQRLQQYDLVVVVCPLPRSFIASELTRLDQLRSQLKVPFVLYQNYYLATRGDWAEKIKDPKNYGGGYGLERFDWYLAASVVSDVALKRRDVEHPVSLIGHDLRADNLYIEKDETFKVLVDFDQSGMSQYRTLQLEALEQTGIQYTLLKGRYTQAEIRALYRSHGALFLSFRESFGLPIVENQLCGSLIFAAEAAWTPSHFIDKSWYDPGVGQLGRNFRIYHNDLSTLKAQLLEARDNYDPQQVLTQFQQDYPQLYQGDLAALQAMLDKVSSGQIHYQSHRSYQSLLY